jgi:hypothetical protein
MPVLPGTADATKCKHCHSEIPVKRKTHLLAKYNTFRVGFLLGTLFTLIMAILVYYQFKGSP